jgi:hypothetical protein
MENATSLEPNFTRMLAAESDKTLTRAERPSAAEAAAAIERRAALQQQALDQVLAPALKRLPSTKDGTMRSLQEQHVRLVARPISEETARRWADADVKDFRELDDAQRRAAAALVMVQNSRTDWGYRSRITDAAPDVAEDIEERTKSRPPSPSERANDAQRSSAEPVHSSNHSGREIGRQQPTAPARDPDVQRGTPSGQLPTDARGLSLQLRAARRALVHQAEIEAERAAATIAKHVRENGLSVQQERVVMDRVHSNIFAAAYRGAMPQGRMLEPITDRLRGRDDEHEPQR